jgi:hypothetical protein
MFLLTDGTVLCQDVGAGRGGSPNWWKLTPDAFGSYLNGTWSQVASSMNGPLYYASGVLRDGRVYIVGGEYNNGAQVELAAATVYDPVANSWTNLPVPSPGWNRIGDASSAVLPDGTLMIGHLDSNKTAIYNPATNTWTAGATKLNSTSSEETWTLLPDQTVMTANCTGHPATQKYVIPANAWVSSGPTPNDLVEAASIEIGPGIVLPDGRLFMVGATGFTALYTMPPIANQAGTWAAGPTLPQVSGQQLGAKDAGACLLPNGKVLCVVGPVDGQANSFLTPSYLFEYDPVANTLTSITNPPNSGRAPYEGRLLLLPTGQAVFSNQSTDVELYTPDGAPDPAWKPQITACPTTVRRGLTYTLSGRQLNGLSQAVSYGDDAMAATNYPIVRISNLAGGQVTFCRTHDHSTLGVQTGTTIHSTRFTVPSSIELGPSELCVIANGISSDCFAVEVSTKIWKDIKWEVKEVKELKENLKREIEVFEKKIIEDKRKDAAFEVDLGSIDRGDPEWLQAVRLIAERTDELSAELAKRRPFVKAAERPAVGEEALAAAVERAGPPEMEEEEVPENTASSEGKPGPHSIPPPLRRRAQSVAPKKATIRKRATSGAKKASSAGRSRKSTRSKR